MFIRNSFFALISLTSLLHALTLDDVLLNALHINPEIAEQKNIYKEISHDIDMAEAGYLPKIAINAESSLRDSRKINANNNIYDIDLSFKQNLFNGFSDINKNRLESVKYQSSFYTLMELTNSISIDVIEAYLSVVKEKKIEDIQKASVLNHQNILNKIQRKYDIGLGTKLELNLSKTSLLLAKINYNDQKNSLIQAKDTLKKFTTIFLNDTLEYPIYDVNIPQTFDDILDIAFEKHPSLHVAELNKKLIEHELAYTKSYLYPTLDLEANYYTGEDSTYRALSDEYYSIKLRLTYNLYNGGYDVSSEQKIKAKLEQKEALKKKVKRDITYKLQSKYDEYLILQEKVLLIQDYVTYKEKALESYYDEFSIGKAQLRDILDTTESLYSAKKRQIEDEYNLLLAKYTLLEAMGILPNIPYNKHKNATIVAYEYY